VVVVRSFTQAPRVDKRVDLVGSSLAKSIIWKAVGETVSTNKSPKAGGGHWKVGGILTDFYPQFKFY